MASMIRRDYQTFSRVPFVVRAATVQDRKCVLELKRAALEEDSDHFIRTRDEFVREEKPVGDELVALLSRNNSLWIVAELDGEVVGTLDFHGGEFDRTRHAGSFSLTVRQDVVTQGVGTALIESLLDWARDHPFVEKVCTTLSALNTRTIDLCSRFGFQVEGRRHREYLVSPGRHLDAVLLSKWVK